MMLVGELMTRKPVTIEESDSLAAARGTMERLRIRHLPVTDASGRFKGLVTHRDILAYTISRLADIDDATQSELDEGIAAGEVMRQGVLTAHPAMTVREAAQIMLDNKYGCLPVLENGSVVGILTEADFIKLTIGLIDELTGARTTH